MVSSRRLLHCSSRSPGLKTSPAEEDEQQPALSYRTTSMGLCSALSFRASAASQPPARRRGVGGAGASQANRKRAPPPSALWTELDPGRGLGGRGRGGGVVAGWRRVLGLSVGARSRCCSHAGPPEPPQPSTGKAAALQRHRVPGDRCPRPPVMSAPRRPGGGSTASPPPRRPSDPVCPHGCRDAGWGGFGLTPVPTLRWRAVARDPAQPRAGKVC